MRLRHEGYDKGPWSIRDSGGLRVLAALLALGLIFRALEVAF